MSLKKFVTVIFFAIVSCEFQYDVAVQTVEPEIKVLVQPNTTWCLECICHAVSNCTRTLKCNGPECGLFKITWQYWIDAGKPTIIVDDPNTNFAYIHCATTEKCATIAVTNYLTRFQQDCNEDGIINCYDYAAIHMNGGYNCSLPLTEEYKDKLAECNVPAYIPDTNSSFTEDLVSDLSASELSASE